MSPPLVSIIVPSYNQGRFIRETIDSVLSQDYRPIELIVMDGASTDETVSVLQSYGERPELRWRSERDSGVVDAVNKALAEAQGEIIAIQSSDDFYTPGAIKTAVDEFERDPALGLLYGDVEYVDEDSKPLTRTSLPPFDLHEYIGKITYIPQASAFFRASAMRDAGGWRDDVSYAADAEFFLRISLKHRTRKIDALLARYRYHAAQRDKEQARVSRDWEKAIEPFTRDADPKIRRAAKGSVWLVRNVYTPKEQWLRRGWYSYRMALANPAMLRHMEKRDLLIGWEPLMRVLSRVKQGLGFRPRGK